MNISYNWLKELIAIELPAGELAEKLTRVGLAVEGIHPHGEDFIFDIDLTSNRPDCLSHLGVAREIRVITGKKLSVETHTHDDGEEIPHPAILAADIVKIEDPELCHRFTARIIRNVKIGPSPEWLVKWLESVGERSINNVADITNYVMLELGQPMHSFDLDKLTGHRIVVRRAKHGESIKTLDEVERKLDETMLMICDAEKPVAVGGIMGGLDSSITHETVNVLLEVAYFKRESIRHTSRSQGLSTEASYRFERGVDIENLKQASDRAAGLIRELAGGEIGEFVDVYPMRFTPNKIESEDISGAVKRLTGLDVSDDECVRILGALGIATNRQSQIADRRSRIFASPSWRHDIAIEEDLVEEIARHSGYENIGEELPPAFGAGEYQANEIREKTVRQRLTDLGFDEAISYSFIDTKFDNVFELIPGLEDENALEKLVTLKDSVIEGSVRMRPSLLSGLLDAVRLNFNHQRRDIRLFEIGKVFASGSGEQNLPHERELLSLVVTGGDVSAERAMPTRILDFYDAKGALEAALDAIGIAPPNFTAESIRHLTEGQAAAVFVNGQKIGSIGRLNAEISADYKFKQPVYVAEIDLQTALETQVAAPVYRALPKFPAIIRDVSFLVKRSLAFSEIQRIMAEQAGQLCRSVSFVDVYEGKGLNDDERSVTVRLEYRNDERTLIDEEVNAVHEAAVRAVEAELGIRQRI